MIKFLANFAEINTGVIRITTERSVPKPLADVITVVDYRHGYKTVRLSLFLFSPDHQSVVHAIMSDMMTLTILHSKRQTINTGYLFLIITQYIVKELIPIIYLSTENCLELQR